jgi:PTH2 family peptidyl-tRNA hydrolase
MRRGKAEAQAAHASMKVFFDKASIFATENSYLMEIPLTKEMAEWASGIFTKISLSCGSEEELDELFKKAKELNLPCSMVVDSGATEFHGVPTKTCVAIGPAKAEDIDKITGHLTLR